MDRLRNTIQPYAWGSYTALAQLQGRPSPSPGPEAELWLGAHPGAPSEVVRGGQALGLEQAIALDPTAALGPRVAQTFQGRLPFLLKVLAAAKPLSLQAHPSKAQAQAGFAREEAQGIARDAPQRNYRDENHKPELICALTRFDALCGFRALPDTLRLLEGLAVAALTPHLEVLRRDGPVVFLGGVLRSAERKTLARAVAKAVEAHPVPGFEKECAWGVRLAQQYPSDAGLVGALCLNLVTLQPGEALSLDAGNLHAYLEGVGVEVMANSDNVLRGGLTPKHVAVEELLTVLAATDGPVTVLRPQGSPEAVYATPAAEFRLSRLDVTGPQTLARWGPDLLLVTEGEVRVGSETLAKGQSAFVPFSDGSVTVDGTGTVFRATVAP